MLNHFRRQAEGISEQKLREGDKLGVDGALIIPHVTQRQAPTITFTVDHAGARDGLVVEADPIL
jgi:hypothetical protein